MFWFGFWVGVIGVLLIEAIAMTVFFIIAYNGAPMAEDEEQEKE